MSSPSVYSPLRVRVALTSWGNPTNPACVTRGIFADGKNSISPAHRGVPHHGNGCSSLSSASALNIQPTYSNEGIVNGLFRVCINVSCLIGLVYTVCLHDLYIFYFMFTYEKGCKIELRKKNT